MVSGDERFFRLHQALHDDVYRNVAPGTLCRKFGVSWLDLVSLWNRHSIYSGLLVMLNHLPRIAMDSAEDSEKRERTSAAVRDLRIDWSEERPFGGDTERASDTNDS